MIVTQDADYLRLHASGLPHRCIVHVHQQTSVSHMLRSLMLCHDVLSPDDMVSRSNFSNPRPQRIRHRRHQPHILIHRHSSEFSDFPEGPIS